MRSKGHIVLFRAFWPEIGPPCFGTGNVCWGAVILRPETDPFCILLTCSRACHTACLKQEGLRAEVLKQSRMMHASLKPGFTAPSRTGVHAACRAAAWANEGPDGGHVYLVYLTGPWKWGCGVNVDRLRQCALGSRSGSFGHPQLP